MANEPTESSLLEKAVNLCLGNAKQYLRDADLLHSFKSYRQSLALTAMSGVELGKAVIYPLRSKGLVAQETLSFPFNSC